MKRLDHLFHGYFGRNARDDVARASLVQTLYNQPTSLVLGAMSIGSISIAAALITKNPAIEITAAFLVVLGVARAVMAYLLKNPARISNVALLERLFEVGAFPFAFLSGLLAALALYYDAPAHVQVAVCCQAISYASGICARNAGRPFIALGQIMLAVIPLVTACLLIGSVVLLVLSVSIFLMAIALVSITMNVFRTLKEQINAADASARLAEKMRLLARTDVVTGLLNRAGLNHDMVEMLMALPPDRKLGMFWLDLDKFKEVNDTLGHPVGDKVLAEVASRLREQAPAGACIARFGGDEFIVVAEVPDRAACEQLARALNYDLGRSTRIDGHRIDTASSMGVALLPDDGKDIDTLLKCADLALYHAKIGGRNQICFFDGSMTRELIRRKEIEAELRAAIQRDELSIFFQPIVDLATGRIRTFEALVRWFHPEKGELRPDEFIPVAEETGVIITLGNWITAQAAKACAQWPEHVTIAVNLSPLQIRAPGAALGILNALREAGLDPRRLELEVTESLFLDDNANTARFIEDLSAEGVRFALDDFGTGYSSLGYISKFPFKKIKVDRSFVSGPTVGRTTDAIIRAVAELGHSLDMDIVAEGLETIEQVKAVRDAGCSLGQGYYFSRPVPDYLAALLLTQEDDGDQRVRLVG